MEQIPAPLTPAALVTDKNGREAFGKYVRLTPSYLGEEQAAAWQWRVNAAVLAVLKDLATRTPKTITTDDDKEALKAALFLDEKAADRRLQAQSAEYLRLEKELDEANANAKREEAARVKLQAKERVVVPAGFETVGGGAAAAQDRFRWVESRYMTARMVTVLRRVEYALLVYLHCERPATRTTLALAFSDLLLYADIQMRAEFGETTGVPPRQQRLRHVVYTPHAAKAARLEAEIKRLERLGRGEEEKSSRARKKDKNAAAAARRLVPELDKERERVEKEHKQRVEQLKNLADVNTRKIKGEWISTVSEPLCGFAVQPMAELRAMLERLPVLLDDEYVAIFDRQCLAEFFNRVNAAPRWTIADLSGIADEAAHADGRTPPQAVDEQNAARRYLEGRIATAGAIDSALAARYQARIQDLLRDYSPLFARRDLRALYGQKLASQVLIDEFTGRAGDPSADTQAQLLCALAAAQADRHRLVEAPLEHARVKAAELAQAEVAKLLAKVAQTPAALDLLDVLPPRRLFLAPSVATASKSGYPNLFWVNYGYRPSATDVPAVAPAAVVAGPAAPAEEPEEQEPADAKAERKKAKKAVHKYGSHLAALRAAGRLQGVHVGPKPQGMAEAIAVRYLAWYGRHYAWFGEEEPRRRPAGVEAPRATDPPRNVFDAVHQTWLVDRIAATGRIGTRELTSARDRLATTQTPAPGVRADMMGPEGGRGQRDALVMADSRSGVVRAVGRSSASSSTPMTDMTPSSNLGRVVPAVQQRDDDNDADMTPVSEQAQVFAEGGSWLTETMLEMSVAPPSLAPPPTRASKPEAKRKPAASSSSSSMGLAPMVDVGEEEKTQEIASGVVTLLTPAQETAIKDALASITPFDTEASILALVMDSGAFGDDWDVARRALAAYRANRSDASGHELPPATEIAPTTTVHEQTAFDDALAAGRATAHRSYVANVAENYNEDSLISLASLSMLSLFKSAAAPPATSSSSGGETTFAGFFERENLLRGASRPSSSSSSSSSSFR